MWWSSGCQFSGKGDFCCKGGGTWEGKSTNLSHNSQTYREQSNSNREEETARERDRGATSFYSQSYIVI